MNLYELPPDVLVYVLQFLSAKSVLSLALTMKEFRENPIWEIYCQQKRLNIEGKTDWLKLVQRVAHIPSHVLNSHVNLLVDYDDEATLQAKKKTWTKIFSKWDKYALKRRNEIRAAIVQGVPMSMRATLWKMCLNLHEFPPVDYEALATSDLCREDIRRYLNIDYTRICRSATKSAYQNVLCALSAYDKDILYTPAMGILATMLLNYLDEEDAFKALATLMHGKYALKGMFVEGLPKLHAEGRIFKWLFEKQFPRLYPKCSMVVDHILAIPMLGIFTALHPNIGMDKIWDMIMLDGYDLILCVLLALLAIHEDKFHTGNEEQIFTSFIRLGTLEDVFTQPPSPPSPTYNSTSNFNLFKSSHHNKSNNKKKSGGLGVEVISVGDVIRMDKLLDLAFKYHKKIAPKLHQFKLDEVLE